MKRFVVGTNQTTAAQDWAFLADIRAKWPQVGWWHQLGQLWFFVDPTAVVTTSALRETARHSFPGIYVMVMEVPPGATNWAGYGPIKGQSGDMFTWMQQIWEQLG